MTWTGKTVCVTGGSGFLGYHLVRLLQERGARVRVLCLPPRAGHPLDALANLERHYGDLLDPTVTRRAVAGCDIVFHTAGIVAVGGAALRKMHTVHVEGTQLVLEACEPNTRIVHTSSIVAVGATPTGEVLDEEHAFALDSLAIDYVHAKRRAERVAMDAVGHGRNVTIVNPGYLVGPDDHEASVMGKTCARYWRGNLLLAPPGGYNLVDVRDVAEGHLLAAERGRAGRRYILGGENHSGETFLRLLAEAAGLRPRLLPTVPLWVMRGLGEVGEWHSRWTDREPFLGRQHALLNRYFWYGSSRRANEELGYRARPIRETLADTYAWFTARRPWKRRAFTRWWFRLAA